MTHPVRRSVVCLAASLALAALAGCGRPADPAASANQEAYRIADANRAGWKAKLEPILALADAAGQATDVPALPQALTPRPVAQRDAPDWNLEVVGLDDLRWMRKWLAEGFAPEWYSSKSPTGDKAMGDRLFRCVRCVVPRRDGDDRFFGSDVREVQERLPRLRYLLVVRQYGELVPPAAAPLGAAANEFRPGRSAVQALLYDTAPQRLLGGFVAEGHSSAQVRADRSLPAAELMDDLLKNVQAAFAEKLREAFPPAAK
jgi:hypothetical protein